MPTTSLLILLVVAIWAAYLLQHWIRRREALATARSVDRFSEAMRVLAKRDPLPQGIAPMVRSGSRAMQAPQVSVKAPRTSLRAGQNMVGADMNDEHTTGQIEQESARAPRLQGIAVGGKNAVAKVRSLDGRQVRGICLLAALGFTGLTLLLAPFGVVSWWLPLIGFLGTAGVVAWLRSTVIAQQKARRAEAPKRAPRRTVRTETVAVPADAAVVSTEASDNAEVREPAAETESDRTPAPFGFEQAAPVVERPAFETEPGTDADGWQPTQVPRPTYAMKERAPQTDVAPAPTVADTPIEELPFDGLALDEELEELPAVYRAG